jgi:hypothetical protein
VALVSADQGFIHFSQLPDLDDLQSKTDCLLKKILKYLNLRIKELESSPEK